MNKRLFCFLIAVFLFKTSNSQTESIINSKAPPKELTKEFLKIVGDSIKIIKADNYNLYVYLINKKDTIEISYGELKYSAKPLFDIASQFETIGKTKVITSYPFTMLCVNAKSISFVNFKYEDMIKSKNYLFFMTKEKLKELTTQIQALVDNK